MRRFLPIALLVIILAAPILACGGDKRGPLVFAPDKLPEAQVGQPYSVIITISENRTPVFQFGADEKTLPPGLAGVFDKQKQSYTLSGTPAQSGTYKFRVDAMCYGTNVSGQMGPKEYELVVK